MNWLKQKKTAVCVMIVLIAAGIWVGAYRSLSGLVQNTQTAFFEGENGDGYGIQGDLEDRSALAYNMALVAGRYLEEDDPLLAGVEAARTALSQAQTPSQKYSANEALSDSVTALYERLKTVELSEKDAKYPQNLYADFTAKQDIINRNSYNRLAGECNAALSAFPANLLRQITFVQPVEYFR